MRKHVIAAGLIALVALVVAVRADANVIQNDPITAPPACTASQFREVALRSYLPWSQRRTEKDTLTALKGCAQNEKTRRLMIQIERKLAHVRAKTIRNYHRWTPYVYPNMRLAIPESVAYCESGLNYNASGGMYGFLDSTWSYYSNLPGPAGGNHLEQHRIAHKIAVSVGPSAWECWGGRLAMPFDASLTLPGYAWTKG